MFHSNFKVLENSCLCQVSSQHSVKDHISVASNLRPTLHLWKHPHKYISCKGIKGSFTTRALLRRGTFSPCTKTHSRVGGVCFSLRCQRGFKKSLKLEGIVLHFDKCTYHFVAESLMRSLIPLSYLYIKVAFVSVLCWRFISSDIISKLTLASVSLC